MKNSINALRVLTMDEINEANSGHPGVVLGFAPVAYVLFKEHLKVTPNKADWFNRDRFVLASGHASSMLYSLLHLKGFDVSMKDLKNFRKLNSKTPGHPEYGHTEGVDSTSGPLGQGIAMAAGMALAEEFLRNKFNKDNLKLVDHYTFVECGDGDLQEGVTLEALQFIGRQKLNKLIILFDSNKVQLDGPVANAGGFPNAKAFFTSLGFNYMEIKNVENEKAVSKAIAKAKESDLPTIIECHTVIGFGSEVAGTCKAHGAPLGAELTYKLRETLKYHKLPFKVSKAVYNDYRVNNEANYQEYLKWEETLKEYAKKFPKEYKEFERVLNNDYELDPSAFKDFAYETEATRKTVGKFLTVASKELPCLMAGSADLTASTMVKGADGAFDIDNRLGRNINFGVREHSMGAIANGMTLHNLRVMTGAFFVFSDYMKPAIRMAALMNIPTVFVFTHDSIAVGEDGPTHEPIEQLAGLRAIPNVDVFRPADAREAVEVLKFACKNKTNPVVIVLTRQNLPLLSAVSETELLSGAIVRQKFADSVGTLVATGSEVSLALDAAKLINKHVNVVEITSTRRFDQNPDKAKIINRNLPSMFVEMASPFGLKAYADEVYAINRFGASANANVVIPYFGFTKEEVAKSFTKLIKK